MKLGIVGAAKVTKKRKLIGEGLHELQRTVAPGKGRQESSRVLFLFVHCKKRSSGKRRRGRQHRMTIECVRIRSVTWVGREEARTSHKVLDNRSATDLSRRRVGGGTGRVGVVACHHPRTVE